MVADTDPCTLNVVLDARVVALEAHTSETFLPTLFNATMDDAHTSDTFLPTLFNATVDEEHASMRVLAIPCTETIEAEEPTLTVWVYWAVTVAYKQYNPDVSVPLIEDSAPDA
jgi:hypothetical protein